MKTIIATIAALFATTVFAAEPAKAPDAKPATEVAKPAAAAPATKTEAAKPAVKAEPAKTEAAKTEAAKPAVEPAKK